jgi:hypothetical protein
MQAVVECGGWDGPLPSDRSEFEGSARLCSGLAKVFLSILDSHPKHEQVAKRRKRIE